MTCNRIPSISLYCLLLKKLFTLKTNQRKSKFFASGTSSTGLLRVYIVKLILYIIIYIETLKCITTINIRHQKRKQTLSTKHFSEHKFISFVLNFKVLESGHISGSANNKL